MVALTIAPYGMALIEREHMIKQKILEQALREAGKKDLGFVDDSPHEGSVEYYDDGGIVLITCHYYNRGDGFVVVATAWDDDGQLLFLERALVETDDEISKAVKFLVGMVPEIKPTWKTFGLRDLQ